MKIFKRGQAGLAIGLVSLLGIIVWAAGAEFLQAEPVALEIKQVWSGNLPVAALEDLPEAQRHRPIGYIDSADTFALIWQQLQEEPAVPVVDFDKELVVFARNRDYFNAIRIGSVRLADGVAEILAMETLTSRPITDMVGFSMAVVKKEGIKALMAGDLRIEIE
jgi:hypothetical protein